MTTETTGQKIKKHIDLEKMDSGLTVTIEGFRIYDDKGSSKHNPALFIEHIKSGKCMNVMKYAANRGLARFALIMAE